MKHGFHLPSSTQSRIVLLVLSFGLIATLGLSVMLTSAQTFGSNWTGSYYNNTSFSGTPALTRLDAQINFNFGAGSPFTGTINPDNFSATWASSQTFTAGTYRFTAIADDGVRVQIDGQTVIDSLVATGGTQTLTADVILTEGVHAIRVDYVEFTNAALVQFYWSSVSTTPSATEGPTATPAPTGLPAIAPGSLTATVIRAGVLNTRNAPSLGGIKVGEVLKGQTYAVVGRNENATWFLLQLGGYQAWAWGYYLYINSNEFNAPVVSGLSAVGLPAGVTDTGVLAVTNAGLRLRAEANIGSAQIGRVDWGSFVPVVGRTRAGDWYQIVWKGTVGWVVSGYLDIRQGDLNNVPVR